jgi:aminomethyltransferase
VSGELKETPLREVHVELGAKMVGFSGWNMPIRYGSILQEHKAVREGAGAFDISHMGQFFVEGPDAASWLNKLLTNNVDKLGEGEGQYTFLLNEKGGVIDDLLLYRIHKDSFFLVVNASKIAEDYAWMKAHRKGDVEFKDRSGEVAGMAVQGPRSTDVYSRMMGGRTLPPRNGVDDFEVEGQRILVCRTGYTGEDGFEFFSASGGGAHWFRSVLSDGAVPCGLGARDTLRLEMCYPLNGSDLSPERSPLEAGLAFFVDLEKGEFMGRGALVAQKSQGLSERLAAIRCLEAGPPIRPGTVVQDSEGKEISRLTSGTLSPSLGVGIGLAYLPRALAKVGSELGIEVRGRKIPAEVVKKPFYKKG